jgi:hypothetical protein
LHRQSTEHWQRRSISQALVKLGPVFSAEKSPFIVRLSWQGDLPTLPSPEIIVSLQSLVAAVRSLGIPQGVETGVVRDLVESFVEQARALDGWGSMDGECAAQGAVDVGFLVLLSGGDASRDTLVQSLLAKVCNTTDRLRGVVSDEQASATSSDLAKLLPGILSDHLRRTQLLLYPLIRHLPESALVQSNSTSAISVVPRKANYLRLGPAPVGEFRSPVAVAKPGKRFGLLSIAV